jgi:DNA-binding PadR family transcriptional regulator
MGLKKLVPRGFLTTCILKQLKDGPKHGYYIIKSIEKETGWEPSPGAVYPTLHELKERGLITKKRKDRKIFYKLTKEGRELIHTLEKSMGEMKDRFGYFIGVLGQILGVSESELRNLIKKHEGIQKNRFFLLPPKIREPMFESRSFILKIAKDKTKHKKLMKILKDTKQELKKLSGE